MLCINQCFTYVLTRVRIYSDRVRRRSRGVEMLLSERRETLFLHEWFGVELG